MKHSSSTTISTILLSLLLLFLTAHFTGTSAIPNTQGFQATCKLAASANPVINYDFCVLTFESEPKSGNADARGLANIAALISFTHSTDVTYNIQDLLSKLPDPATKSCLEQCMSLYESMLNALPEAMDTINLRDDEAAKGLLKTAIEESQNCEAGFSNAGEASPLTQLNNNSVELNSMALTILGFAN
ncbi:Plant invertase/pectin methylesterase inhibitor protein [Dioscorea alata]|uniref:Plant invertase/pectin methylesterase inhibitor protein n=1 Tax=Dioscorea alata TaxID=55571 RepID=A0ACB7UFT9_DIOAL|nr:Plant invertase/pectin methylesterase inhibitor protein [Dioscorea alata]